MCSCKFSLNKQTKKSRSSCFWFCVLTQSPLLQPLHLQCCCVRDVFLAVLSSALQRSANNTAGTSGSVFVERVNELDPVSSQENNSTTRWISKSTKCVSLLRPEHTVNRTFHCVKPKEHTHAHTPHSLENFLHSSIRPEASAVEEQKARQPRACAPPSPRTQLWRGRHVTSRTLTHQREREAL